MKMKLLSLAVAGVMAGVAGSASAGLVENGAGGAAVGNILLVPYYTVQNGNSTLINIVNTDTVNGKAVKVRFRGGKDSDDIFDFQLFMSPGDVWTANISQNSNGLAYLTTTDKTCSLPAASVLNATPFITARLPSGDVGGTLEGYVEIFNMADIPTPKANIGRWTKAYSTMTATEKAATLFGTIKHTAGVAACDNTILTSIEAQGAAAVDVAANGTALGVDGGGWDNVNTAGVNMYPADTDGAVDQGEKDAYAELIRPTGGLMGNWTIINVPNTTVYSGEAVAIAATGATRVVYSRQTDDAVVARVAASDFPDISSTYDAVLLSTGYATAEYDFPDLSTPYETATANAAQQALDLSNSIAHNTLINEFLLDSAVSASTDWLVSMPTRRYSVAGRGTTATGVAGTTTGTYASATLLADNATDSVILLPNDTAYLADGDALADVKNGAQFHFAGVTTYAADGRSSCVNIGAYSQTDREETTATTNNVVVSPSTVSSVALCGEVNVLSLNNLSTNTGALGAKLAVSPLSIPYASGWAVVNLNGLTGKTTGLPAIGYSFVKAVNPAVSAGVSGTFGGASAHRW